MKFLMETRWEWVEEIEVEADHVMEAEVLAVTQAKERLAELFEDGTPSMEEFDLLHLG